MQLNIWKFMKKVSNHKKVFVSYTNADEALVQHIVRDMEEQGLDVWFAPKSLTGGDRLSTILDKIKWADVAVVILSASAVNSRWVQHELNTAIALYLDGSHLQIIPVCVDLVERPLSIVDFVPVTFDCDDYYSSIEALLAAIKGSDKITRDPYSTFLGYVNSLAVLEEDVFQRVLSNAIFMRNSSISSGNRRDPATMKLAREWQNRADQIVEETKAMLIAYKVTEEQCNDILAWMRSKQEYSSCELLPMITQEDRSSIQDWHRMADGDMLRFAAALWREQDRYHHSRGITIRWIIETFFVEYLCYASLLEDEMKADWKARDVIVPKARGTGLLAESTERLHPSTYAYKDAQVNPGFDFGPMVHIVGRVAQLWELTHPKYCLRSKA